MLTKRVVIVAGLGVVAAATMASLSGCLVLAAGAGAGTYAYVSGAVETTLSAPIDEVNSAAVAACGALGFTGVNSTGDALAKEIAARTGKDEAVKIKMTKEGDSSTKVSVRIGNFGDEARSNQILDAIKKRL
ncbi:MAG: DUF3568 family protein [Planctomycetota bacterium]|nr:DUF3568 family protein [Planctomycetota bacterium]